MNDDQQNEAGERSTRERKLESDLQVLGFTISEEIPDAELGTLVVTALHVDSGEKVSAQGDTRENALMAVLVASRSKGL